MIKVSKITLSFFFFALLALILSTLAWVLGSIKSDKNHQNINTQSNQSENQVKLSYYQSSNNGFSFNYPKDWRISDTTLPDQTPVLALLTPDSSDPILLTVTKDDFYATDGLPVSPAEVKGLQAIKIDDQIIGVRSKNLYLTFDLSSNLTKTKDLNDLIKSLKFD